MDPTSQKTYTKWFGGLLMVVLLTSAIGALDAMAFGRDTDGSRMQARHVSLGSTIRDNLMPPKDRVDWRAFKVTRAKSVTIAGQHKPAGARMVIALVNSRGQQVASATSNGGKVTLSQMLKPGVYYFSVSSDARMSYRLNVR